MSADLPLPSAPWLQPDDLADGSHALVEEHAGAIVAAGIRRSSASQATQDPAEFSCLPGYGEELLRALADADQRPIVLRILPGTPEDQATTRVGSIVIQSVPAAYVPTDHPEVAAWARANAGPTSSGTDHPMAQLVDLWVDAYVRMHGSWAPVTNLDALRQVQTRQLERLLDRERTQVSSISGSPVAATFVFGPVDGTFIPVLMSLDHEHADLEMAARASVAAALEAVHPAPVEFDGHADDPTYLAIIEDIPRRGPGVLTPMQLVQIGPAAQ